MVEFLVIDGYNILHSWSSLKNIAVENLEHARARLVDVMVNYSAVKGIKVVIVFDAHLVKGGIGSIQEISGVEIVYTAYGETADMLIEKLATRLRENDRLIVATSDWTEQRMVFGKGAMRLSARELEIEVNTCHEDLQNWIESLPKSDSKLRGYLKEDIKEILEKIRRNK